MSYAINLRFLIFGLILPRPSLPLSLTSTQPLRARIMPTATLIVLQMASANLAKLNNHFGVFALGGCLISLALHGKSPSSEVYPNIAHKTTRLTSSIGGFLNNQAKYSRMSVLN